MLPSADGHTAVLVAVDVLSRYAILAPMFSIDSEETAALATLLIINGTGGSRSGSSQIMGQSLRASFSQCVSTMVFS